MNLTSFLTQIDKISAEYTKEQLSSFVHEMARVIPEFRREEFLDKLRSWSEESQEKGTEVRRIADEKEEYETIIRNLELIDSGEIYLEEMPNEEYDDWYYGEEEEFFYHDSSGISEMLEKACDYVHKCVDEEHYTHGFEVGSRLCAITVSTDGEYSYGEDFTINEMVYHELLERDVKNVVYDTLYCGYMGLSDEQRIEDMYEALRNSQIRDITVEGLMQHGDAELPDFDCFLDKWVEYLGGQKGTMAEALFNESVRLMNDPHKACALADRFMAEHPGAYLQILSHSEGLSHNKLVEIGYAAIKKIPAKYVVRSQIALVTAANILIGQSPDGKMLDDCYFAAYESNTTPVNYLRALLHGFDSPEKRDLLNRITAKIGEGEAESLFLDHQFRTDKYGEQFENRPGENTMIILKFLEGRFQSVMKQHMNTKEPLGWSGTFMKQGIALFLLYLYEGAWNTSGIEAMMRKVSESMGFSAETFHEGLNLDGDEDGSLFFAVFQRWKSITPMEVADKLNVLDWIEKLLEMRTEGIMNANKRKYYGECASYIAALGEVRESLGEIGEKQRIMTEYKERYPRRTAFRSEMKAFGWMGR